MRHVVATGLRYALHQLGFEPPAKPPVRIHRLRLYLDGGSLARELPAGPAAAAVVGALTDPGGAADDRRHDRRLAGAVAFHRARLRFKRLVGRRPGGRAAPRPTATWAAFRRQTSRLLPSLNDALLGEVVAALDRRLRRARGDSVPPCLGPEAWRLQTGRGPRLEALGVPDPRVPSWAAEPERRTRADAEAGGRPAAARSPLRGQFRERYRAGLDALRHPYLALAGRAVESGLLDREDDAFFIPLDLADDLELPERPGWLAAAVTSNRREYEALLEAPSPPAVLAGELATLSTGRAEGWQWQPLEPLA